jgi:hypothetical protein
MWSGAGSRECRTLLVDLLDFVLCVGWFQRGVRGSLFADVVSQNIRVQNEKSPSGFSTLQLFPFRSLLHGLRNETPQRRPPVVRLPPVF